MPGIILVNSNNIDATIFQKEDGRWDWNVFLLDSNGNGESIRPLGIDDFSSRERALVSMNDFLTHCGFQPQECPSYPLPTIPAPASWSGNDISN